MITYAQGNLLNANVEALVNTVNCVGVMGKGIALAFRERFPENYRQYLAACCDGQIRPGQMFTTDLPNGRTIVNFPTKLHWRAPSQIEWIRDGLMDLRHFIRYSRIKSIAIPPLGCGNGGLNWSIVRPLIESSLSNLDCNIVIYGSPT